MYTTTNPPARVPLRQIRQAHPNVSLSRNPTDEHLNPLGYAVLHPTERPTGDVVTEGVPEQGEDGKWYQTWDVREYTPEELAEALDRVKVAKRHELDQSRDAAFDAGLPCDIAGKPDVIQTRFQDKINLLGLRMEAEGLSGAGITDPVMTFRGQANVQRSLTPTEMIDLTNAALGHIQSIYQQSWQLKDQVDGATAIEEVEGITWDEP